MTFFVRVRRSGFAALLCALLWYGCKSSSSQHPDLAKPAYTSPDSIKALTERILADTTDAGRYYARGVALHALDRDSLALKDFLRAIALDSTKAEYHSAVGDLLFEARDITASLPFLRKAVALNPDEPLAHIKLAKMMLFMKEYNPAFKELNTALRADVHNPEAYFLKGMLYKDIGNDSEAIASFQTAVQEDPSYADAYFQIGALLTARGDSTGLQYWANAARLAPRDPTAHYARGKYFADRKEYERAKEAYRAATAANGAFAPAHYALGYVYLQQDSAETARGYFADAVRHAPGSPEARYNLGLCKEILGDVAGAEAEYRQALAIDSTYEAAQKALARVEGK